MVDCAFAVLYGRKIETTQLKKQHGQDNDNCLGNKLTIKQISKWKG